MSIQLNIDFQFVTKEEEEAFKDELIKSMKDANHVIDLSKYITNKKQFVCEQLSIKPIEQIVSFGKKPLVINTILKASLIQF